MRGESVCVCVLWESVCVCVSVCVCRDYSGPFGTICILADLVVFSTEPISLRCFGICSAWLSNVFIPNASFVGGGKMH